MENTTIKDLREQTPAHTEVKLVSILVVWSMIILFFQSKNSPLYVLNDWSDLNAFLTIGKSWANGLIPYRDLFEQKGPTLFFIFYLISKISASYWLVYVFEIIFLAASLWLLYQIARLYYQPSASLTFAIISGVMLTVPPYFNFGGSAEEFAFPFIIYSLLVMFRYYHKHEISNKEWLIFGIGLALVFWSKYTMIGSFLAVAMGCAIAMLLKKDYPSVRRLIVASSVGFLLISVIILAYFLAKGALMDLYMAYFYSNIKLYPGNEQLGLVAKIINSFVLFIQALQKSWWLFILAILGCFQLVSQRRIMINNGLLLNFFFALCTLIVTTYFGGKTFDYYMLSLSPFLCLTLLPLVKGFDHIDNKPINIMMVALLSLVLALGMSDKLMFSKLYPNNLAMSLDGKSNQPAQQLFADIIQTVEQPSLLTYGTIDIGVYQAADVLPSNYYFQKVNITQDKLPEMMAEQNQLIDQQAVTFVYLRQKITQDETTIPENIRKNYTLVKKHAQHSAKEWCYYLYQSNNSLK